MKTLISLLTILFISFSSNSVDKCIIKLTKEDLQADKIEFQCQNFNDNKKFSIKGFSIKFPNHPTVVVKGTKLDLKTKSYIKELKINQIVTVFDIKSAYQKETLISTKDIPSFLY